MDRDNALAGVFEAPRGYQAASPGGGSNRKRTDAGCLRGGQRRYHTRSAACGSSLAVTLSAARIATAAPTTMSFQSGSPSS